MNSPVLFALPFSITSIYAAILGLIFFALSVRTIALRWRHKVSIGYGANRGLEKAVRVHANFSEYVPLTLLLLLLLEWQAIPVGWVYGLNTCLLLGRCLHAYGVGSSPQILPLRMAGMIFTFIALVGASTGLLWGHLWVHFSF